jgi:5'-3' exonuclease
MNNLILVDASYTSFYRFFATLRWFSLNQPDFYKEKKNDVKYNWAENTIFIEKYENMYLESIIKLGGKKEFNNSKVIFCLDSPKDNVWRSKLTEDYKGDRVDLSLKNNFKPTFKLTYDNIIPKLIKTYPDKIFSIRIEKLEADDIIAVICKNLEEKNNKLKIVLVSGDQDFLQLGRDNLYFINYKTKKALCLNKEEAKEKLKEKILNGDCSDNICSIFPKDKKIMPLKLKKELMSDDIKLNLYLDTNLDIKNKYELNKKLIDFNFIPKNLVKLALDKFNSLQIEFRQN